MTDRESKRRDAVAMIKARAPFLSAAGNGMDENRHKDPRTQDMTREQALRSLAEGPTKETLEVKSKAMGDTIQAIRGYTVGDAEGRDD